MGKSQFFNQLVKYEPVCAARIFGYITLDDSSAEDYQLTVFEWPFLKNWGALRDPEPNQYIALRPVTDILITG